MVARSSVFFLDLPPVVGDLALRLVQDGVAWVDGEVGWEHDGWMTLWVDGLTAEADPGNTVVEIGGVPHYPEVVEPGLGQINVRLRPVLDGDEVGIQVFSRGAVSNMVSVRISGQAPTIRGLELLGSL